MAIGTEEVSGPSIGAPAHVFSTTRVGQSPEPLGLRKGSRPGLLHVTALSPPDLHTHHGGDSVRGGRPRDGRADGRARPNRGVGPCEGGFMRSAVFVPLLGAAV